jgi:type I restriction-modification system DNA methylase subunit
VQVVADYGDDVATEVEADYHQFDFPEGSHWRDVTTKTANLGASINKALGQIEQANPDSLAGIFGDAAWGNKERLPEDSLVGLINAFNSLTLNPDQVSHDLFGQGYEYLLKNFADESGKKRASFSHRGRSFDYLFESLILKQVKVFTTLPLVRVECLWKQSTQSVTTVVILGRCVCMGRE